MPDPTPIPSRLQRLRGNPSKRRIRPDLEPTPVPEPPPPPSFLNDYAKAEWLRVTTELCERGVLSVLDFGMLELYAQSYGRWRYLDELVSQNPDDARLRRAARAEAAMAAKLAIEFGLTAASRSRVKLPAAEPPGKFDGYLAG